MSPSSDTPPTPLSIWLTGVRRPVVALRERTLIALAAEFAGGRWSGLVDEVAIGRDRDRNAAVQIAADSPEELGYLVSFQTNDPVTTTTGLR